MKACFSVLQMIGSVTAGHVTRRLLRSGKVKPALAPGELTASFPGGGPALVTKPVCLAVSQANCGSQLRSAAANPGWGRIKPRDPVCLRKSLHFSGGSQLNTSETGKTDPF